MKEKIKAGVKLELTLQKGNGDFGSTNVEKFQSTTSGPEVDAQLGDIILGNGKIFSFILGNIKANGYKIGYIIQPGNGFESLFGSENHETNITIGILEEGTEKPKKSKIRSDWRTVKILKKRKALKRYRIMKTLRELETPKVLNPLKTLK